MEPITHFLTGAVLGRAGFNRKTALATATMTLSESPTGDVTVMDWVADVVISGTLASVGARMIEGTAKKMIGQTFDCIRTKLEA